MFRSQSVDLLCRLDAALSAGRVKEVGEVAHALKGSTGFWGTTAAFTSARSLELMAQAGSLGDAGLERDRLDASLTRLNDQLDRLSEEVAI